MGAPRGNQNARTHGFYARVEVPEDGGTVERAIAELATRQARLSWYIDGLLKDDDPDLGEVARVMQLYGRAASRLAFFLTYQKTFEGVADRLSERLRKGASGRSDGEGG